MSKKELSAPIFPIQDCSKCQWHGIRERDLFAAIAMNGLLAGGSPVHEYKTCAEIAVKHADSLLAKLAEGKDK